ncbi:glutathione S-transferase [Mycena amicta]|nr:glutathione S-transferase [Mycena amicta]
MVLKLYSAPALGTRGGCGVVALVLAEKQIPFQNIPVDITVIPKRGQNSPEHRARNPFGQIPVIDDDGFVLYETRAICRYLVEKYPENGPKLLPGPTASFQERALFEQAASVESTNYLSIFAHILRWENGKRMRRGFEPGLPVIGDDVLVPLGRMLDVYEQILSKQKYLVGSEITLVDLFHLATLAGFDIIMTSGRRPNVARWWKAITSRPAWVKLREEGIQSTAYYNVPKRQSRL